MDPNLDKCPCGTPDLISQKDNKKDDVVEEQKYIILGIWTILIFETEHIGIRFQVQ